MTTAILVENVIEAISNLPETLRANAQALFKEMTEVRVGLGDRETRWSPTPLRIVQAMTNTDAIEGDAKKGAIVLGAAVSKTPVRVHILRVWDSRALWNADLTNPSIVCQSPDGKTGWRFGSCKECDNSKFHDDTPPACRQQKTFLAITEDLRHIIRIDLSRTQLRIGMDLEKRLNKMSGIPFERVFELKSKKHDKNQAVYVLDPVRTDDYSAPEVSAFLDAIFTLFAERRREEIQAFYDKRNQYEAAKRESAPSRGQAQAPADVDLDVDVPASSGESLPNYEM